MISRQTWASPSLSAEEVATAADYLVVTRVGLIDSLHDLSEAQWCFKPTPDCWSIAGILEHLILVENGIHRIIRQMPNSPVAEPDRNNADIEEGIRTRIPARRGRAQAPPFLEPSNTESPLEMIPLFLQARATTLQLLTESPSLRGHVVPHPFFGPWDGYQWILGASAHCARHTNQIIEWKTAFPANS